MIDGSRRACLEPPYAPGASAASLADGTPVVREAEGRRWIVTLAGERAPSPEEVHASLDALRSQPGLRLVNYGGYCGDGARTCLVLAGNLCELRVEDALRALRDAIAASRLAGMRLEVAVELGGSLGPRCQPGDRDCQPIAYQGGTYDRLGSRIPGAFASHSAGACDHDGECMVMGCGNHCLLWEYGGANEGATCEGYSFPRPIFCGCAEGECQWFTQR